MILCNRILPFNSFPGTHALKVTRDSNLSANHTLTPLQSYSFFIYFFSAWLLFKI